MTPVQVAIRLELGEPLASKLYKGYLKLKGLIGVVLLYEEIGEDVWSYLDLYKLGISTGNSNKEIVSAVDTVLNKLPDAREALDQTKKEENDSFEKKLLLLEDIDFLKRRTKIKKLLTIHQKMIFACILGGALWAMSTVLEKVRKQEELREMHKGDIAE